MIRWFTAALAAAVLAPAALADPTTGQDRANAARACKALQTSLGAATFKSTYGGAANAFGKCVSSTARAEHENRHDAQSACRAERSDANFAASHGGKTFSQFYGAGNSGRNAFGKCVSSKASAASAEQRKDTESAAKRCKAERTSMGAAAFKAKYGGKQNAFGKCVSKLAQEQNN